MTSVYKRPAHGRMGAPGAAAGGGVVSRQFLLGSTAVTAVLFVVGSTKYHTQQLL